MQPTTLSLLLSTLQVRQLGLLGHSALPPWQGQFLGFPGVWGPSTPSVRKRKSARHRGQERKKEARLLGSLSWEILRSLHLPQGRLNSLDSIPERNQSRGSIVSKPPPWERLVGGERQEAMLSRVILAQTEKLAVPL